MRTRCKEGSVHLTLTLTTIFCRCQQLFNCRRSLNQLTQTNHLSKNGQKCFNGNYITTMYFVFCIVCCVVYCLLCITVLYCANKCKFFQQNLISFHKNKNLFCVNYYIFFFEWCRFLNVCMQCPVDSTESLVEPLRFWSRYAVIPLAGLSRRFAGRWRPWACHATNHTNFIYQRIFTIFAAKNSAISRL